MLISLKHNFAFLSNRKCASISIEAMLRKHSDIALLGPPEFRHTNYRSYSRYIAPYIEASAGKTAVETVCLVREPLSWLYSFYRFRSRYGLRNPGDPDHHRSTHKIAFPEFVAAYMQPNPPAYAEIGNQFDFVRDEANRIGVDRIFAYEDMERFTAFISRKVGRDLELRHKNVSPKRNRKHRIAAFTDRVVKSAISLFDLKRVAARPAPAPELPEGLFASLREFLEADYALWRMATAAADESPGTR